MSAWTQGASRRSSLAISPGTCPAGLVRLKVAGAGCDYEVSRSGGFQRTADGAFGVSPIVNRDWATAPEPMKNGLTAILASLTQDPSLPIRAGSAPRHADHASGPPGLQRSHVLAGAGAAVVVAAAAFGLWWRRRKARPASPPAAT